jgi:hypothetical protein
VRVQDLVEIEAIRRLKARYCLGVDGKDWALFRSCFADDAQLGGGLPGAPAAVGPDEWVAGVQATVGTVRTMHALHASIIDIDAPDRARGLWQYTQRGWGRTGGYYDEEYSKRAGAWQIVAMRITPIFANDGTDASESAPGSFAEGALWAPLIAAFGRTP